MPVSVTAQKDKKPKPSIAARSEPRVFEPTVFSLFSGGGGLDIGLEAAGFRTIFASDIDHHSCVTLQQLNAGRLKPGRDEPVRIVHKDIRELDPVAEARAAGFQPGAVNVVAGGPPCQAFSVFGKRGGLSDPRGTLAWEYLRVLQTLRPEVFVFENVYGLLTIDQGRLLEIIIDKLGSPGGGLKYEITMHRLNAVDFGVPQYRDRVFLIGSRIGSNVTHISPWVRDGDDIFTASLPKRRTVRDALRGLPPIGQGGIANHTGRVHSERIKKRYASLKPRERDPKTRINRLDLDSPGFAIIVGSDKGGGKGHVHPTEPREVTPRESARIQTFPDWWAFSGTSRHPIRQVGNAVPTLLAAAVGSALASQIFGLPAIGLKDACRATDQMHLFSPKDLQD